MIRLCGFEPDIDPEGNIALSQELGLWGTGLVLSPEWTRDHAAAFGRHCAAAGLVLAEALVPVGGDWSWALDLAVAAGARSLVVMPPDAGDLDLLAATLRQLAQGAPLRVLVLTRRGSAVATLTAAAEVVRRVAQPNFGLAWDPVELLSMNTYFDNDSFLLRSVQQVGDAMGLVVGRDAVLHPDGFAFRLAERDPGEGGVRYGALLPALHARGDDVPVRLGCGGDRFRLAGVAKRLEALLSPQTAR